MKEKQICLFMFGGTWIVGDKQGDYIKNPRLYLFTSSQHGVMALPEEPEKIPYPKDVVFYKAKENGVVIDLYLQSTGEKPREAKSNIIVPEVMVK